MTCRSTVSFVALTWTLLIGSTSAHAAPPDVYVVIWDTTRARNLSPYGTSQDTTPHLQDIARQATIFDNAEAAAPWTLPSVASLFTGLFTHNHGIGEATQPTTLVLPNNLTTLAESMQHAGYATAIYLAQRIITPKDGYEQGFDVFQHTLEEDLVQHGLNWIDRTTNQPRFLVLYWFDPHAPYEPHPDHDSWTDHTLPDINVTASNRPLQPGWVRHHDVQRGKTRLSKNQYTQLQAKYNGELHQNDAQLGAFWTGLQERNLADRSLFVFTSDHGEGFGEHANNLLWHNVPYDTILHIPLIMRLPGVLPARRVSPRVRILDIYPTILDLIGHPLSHPINGKTLLTAVDGSDLDRPNVGSIHFGNGTTWLRDERYKLIFQRNSTPPYEVYDLTKDPAEQHNLASVMPQLVRSLLQKRATLLQATTLTFESGDARTVSPEDVERLRSLGYVE